MVVDPDYDTQVVDVDDQQLARRVLLFRADQLLRNGTLAHRMAGLFAAAGLVDVKVEAMTLVVRDPNAVDNVMGLRTWAATAHQRGLLAADDAAAWPRAIDRAVAAGRFLYAVTFFLTAGTTPLVRAQPIGCRDPAAAPRHPRWTHSSVQAIVTSHAGSPTPEHPKSITAPKRPSLTSRFAALTSRGNQTDGPSHVAPMLFPRPQSPSRQRSDRPTQRWRSGFRRHGLQRPTAEAVVPPRRRSVGRIDLQPPVFLLHLRRVYASALGSRTNMSTPRRKLLLSHPSSSTGVIVRSAHTGETARRPTGAQALRRCPRSRQARHRTPRSSASAPQMTARQACRTVGPTKSSIWQDLPAVDEFILHHR